MPFPRKKGAQSTSIEIRSKKKPTRKAPLFLKMNNLKIENELSISIYNIKGGCLTLP